MSSLYTVKDFYEAARNKGSLNILTPEEKEEYNEMVKAGVILSEPEYDAEVVNKRLKDTALAAREDIEKKKSRDGIIPSALAVAPMVFTKGMASEVPVPTPKHDPKTGEMSIGVEHPDFMKTVDINRLAGLGTYRATSGEKKDSLFALKPSSLRPDYTEKPKYGFLGELDMTDGSGRKVADLAARGKLVHNGKIVSYPLLVPTLTQAELDTLLKGGKNIPISIQEKAIDHARGRLEQGLSPFYAQRLTQYMPLGLTGAILNESGDKGVVSAFFWGAVQGLTTEFPLVAGQAMQYFTPSDLKEKGIDPGKKLADWADKNAVEWFGEDQYSGLAWMINEGTKMVSPSFIPYAGTYYTGTRLLLKLATINKVVSRLHKIKDMEKGLRLMNLSKNQAKLLGGELKLAIQAQKDIKKAIHLYSGIVTSGMFMGAAATDTRENTYARISELESQGKYAEAAEVEKTLSWAPHANALIEFTGEFIGYRYLSKLFGMSIRTIKKRGGAENVVRQWFKDILKSLGIEITTEFGQQTSQATIEKYSNIRPAANALWEGISTIGPVAWMVLMTAGLGAGARMSQAKRQAQSDMIGEYEEVAFKDGIDNTVAQMYPSKGVYINRETGETINNIPVKEAVKIISGLKAELRRATKAMKESKTEDARLRNANKVVEVERQIEDIDRFIKYKIKSVKNKETGKTEFEVSRDETDIEHDSRIGVTNTLSNLNTLNRTDKALLSALTVKRGFTKEQEKLVGKFKKIRIAPWKKTTKKGEEVTDKQISEALKKYDERITRLKDTIEKRDKLIKEEKARLRRITKSKSMTERIGRYTFGERTQKREPQVIGRFPTKEAAQDHMDKTRAAVLHNQGITEGRRRRWRWTDRRIEKVFKDLTRATTVKGADITKSKSVKALAARLYSISHANLLKARLEYDAERAREDLRLQKEVRDDVKARINIVGRDIKDFGSYDYVRNLPYTQPSWLKGNPKEFFKEQLVDLKKELAELNKSIKGVETDIKKIDSRLEQVRLALLYITVVAQRAAKASIKRAEEMGKQAGGEEDKTETLEKQIYKQQQQKTTEGEEDDDLSVEDYTGETTKERKPEPKAKTPKDKTTKAKTTKKSSRYDFQDETLPSKYSDESNEKVLGMLDAPTLTLILSHLGEVVPDTFIKDTILAHIASLQKKRKKGDSIYRDIIHKAVEKDLIFSRDRGLYDEIMNNVKGDRSGQYYLPITRHIKSGGIPPSWLINKGTVYPPGEDNHTTLKYVYALDYIRNTVKVNISQALVALELEGIIVDHVGFRQGYLTMKTKGKSDVTGQKQGWDRIHNTYVKGKLWVHKDTRIKVVNAWNTITRGGSLMTHDPIADVGVSELMTKAKRAELIESFKSVYIPGNTDTWLQKFNRDDPPSKQLLGSVKYFARYVLTHPNDALGIVEGEGPADNWEKALKPENVETLKGYIMEYIHWLMSDKEIGGKKLKGLAISGMPGYMTMFTERGAKSGNVMHTLTGKNLSPYVGYVSTAVEEDLLSLMTPMNVHDQIIKSAHTDYASNMANYKKHEKMGEHEAANTYLHRAHQAANMELSALMAGSDIGARYSEVFLGEDVAPSVEDRAKNNTAKPMVRTVGGDMHLFFMWRKNGIRVGAGKMDVKVWNKDKMTGAIKRVRQTRGLMLKVAKNKGMVKDEDLKKLEKLMFVNFGANFKPRIQHPDQKKAQTTSHWNGTGISSYSNAAAITLLRTYTKKAEKVLKEENEDFIPYVEIPGKADRIWHKLRYTATWYMIYVRRWDVPYIEARLAHKYMVQKYHDVAQKTGALGQGTDSTAVDAVMKGIKTFLTDNNISTFSKEQINHFGIGAIRLSGIDNGVLGIPLASSFDINSTVGGIGQGILVLKDLNGTPTPHILIPTGKEPLIYTLDTIKNKIEKGKGTEGGDPTYHLMTDVYNSAEELSRTYFRNLLEDKSPVKMDDIHFLKDKLDENGAVIDGWRENVKNLIYAIGSDIEFNDRGEDIILDKGVGEFLDDIVKKNLDLFEEMGEAFRFSNLTRHSVGESGGEILTEEEFNNIVPEAKKFAEEAGVHVDEWVFRDEDWEIDPNTEKGRQILMSIYSRVQVDDKIKNGVKFYIRGMYEEYDRWMEETQGVGGGKTTRTRITIFRRAGGRKSTREVLIHEIAHGFLSKGGKITGYTEDLELGDVIGEEIKAMGLTGMWLNNIGKPGWKAIKKRMIKPPHPQDRAVRPYLSSPTDVIRYFLAEGDPSGIFAASGIFAGDTDTGMSRGVALGKVDVQKIVTMQPDLLYTKEEQEIMATQLLELQKELAKAVKDRDIELQLKIRRNISILQGNRSPSYAYGLLATLGDKWFPIKTLIEFALPMINVNTHNIVFLERMAAQGMVRKAQEVQRIIEVLTQRMPKEQRMKAFDLLDGKNEDSDASRVGSLRNTIMRILEHKKDDIIKLNDAKRKIKSVNDKHKRLIRELDDYRKEGADQGTIIAAENNIKQVLREIKDAKEEYGALRFKTEQEINTNYNPAIVKFQRLSNKHFIEKTLPESDLDPKWHKLIIKLRVFQAALGDELFVRDLIDEQTYIWHHGRYTHYMYLKHFIGVTEKFERGGGGKIEAGHLTQREGMTDDVRWELAQIKDIAIVIPVGLGKTIDTIAKTDFYGKLSEEMLGIVLPTTGVPNLHWSDDHGHHIILPDKYRVTKYTFDKNKGVFKRDIVEDLPVPLLEARDNVKTLKQILKVLERKALKESKGRYKFNENDPFFSEKHIKEAIEVLETELLPITKKLEERGQTLDDYTLMPKGKTGKVKDWGALSNRIIVTAVADDILPLTIKEAGSEDRAAKLYAQLAKWNAISLMMFKAGKVALNFPTAFRNIISNFLQNNLRGRPLPLVFSDYALAIKSYIAKDQYYQEAIESGLFQGNWNIAELNDVLRQYKYLAINKKAYSNIYAFMGWMGEQTKYYGKIDELAKLSIYRQLREKGHLDKFGLGMGDQIATKAEALFISNKYGMDYSVAARSIKQLRRQFIPFATYQYKVLPLIAESMATRPWIMAKWIWFIGVPFTNMSLAQTMAKTLMGIDEDEWERLMRQLPEFIAREKTFAPVPWRSADGRMMWFDATYFMPWGTWQAIFTDMSQAEISHHADTLGIGNPFLTAFTALKTWKRGRPPVDPFTKQEIWNNVDPFEIKFLKMFSWLQNLVAPGIFENILVPGHQERQGALGRTKTIMINRLVTGKPFRDKWGRQWGAEQLGRWFGFNLQIISAEQGISIKKARLALLKSDLRKRLRTPSVRGNPRKRERAIKIFQKKARKIMRRGAGEFSSRPSM